MVLSRPGVRASKMYKSKNKCAYRRALHLNYCSGPRGEHNSPYFSINKCFNAVCGRSCNGGTSLAWLPTCVRDVWLRETMTYRTRKYKKLYNGSKRGGGETDGTKTLIYWKIWTIMFTAGAWSVVEMWGKAMSTFVLAFVHFWRPVTRTAENHLNEG